MKKKKSNWYETQNLNCDETQNSNFLQNSNLRRKKTWIQNLNCDKTKKIKL